MSDEPKKPSVGTPTTPKKPKSPALYRNKVLGPGQMPKGKLEELSASKASNPRVLKAPKPQEVENKASSVTAKEAKPAGGVDSVTVGKLASLSNSFKEPKAPTHTSYTVKTKEEKSASPDLPKGKSLSQLVDGLGDLAKTTPSMARTRPTGRAMGEAGEKDYDTKVQKSHSLSMRYRIPTKLQKLFTDEPEKLKKLGNYIMEQIRLYDTERTEFINRLVNYRRVWKDFVSAGLDPAFEGAHDVHVPLAYSNIKAMHARIYQAVMDISPRFSLKPRTKIPEVQKEDKEELLNWIINDYANMQQGWEGVIDEDILNFVADGKAVTKQSWLRDVRKFTDVEETIRRPIELDEDGYPIVDEKEVEKEEVLWDCPILETVKLEDFWIIGKKLWDIDKADLIDHIQNYTKSDMIKSSRLGFFDPESVDEIVKNAPALANEQRTNTNTIALKQLDDFITGVDKVGSRAGIPTYKIHETYLRYDIDDDGIDEELVVWVEENSRRIVRLTYLERVGPGGKRPFTMKLFTPDGKGLGELLYGLNNEIDYIHNQRLDYGTLQNLPFFFYRAASGLNPVILKLAPGSGIPLDNPNEDVMFPRLAGGTAYGFQEEMNVNRYVEKTSGITEFALGQINGQGATRTATGTAALVNELNANIDIHIKRYQTGFKRNLYILDLQCQDLLPLGLIIRVSGADGKDIYKRFEDREALRFAADFELTANSINSNKAIERETAQMLVQNLANPIALQTGITNPGNLYQAFKNLLQKFDVKNIDAFITKPQDTPDSPYDAKDEINMIIAGVKPPLVLKDRHDEKLQVFDEFEKSDDFSWLTQDHIPLYLEVRKYHEQAAQAINAQAANPALQQGMNSLGLSAQLAAGAGAPHGVAQQQSDLGQGGGTLNGPVQPPALG